MLHGATWSKRFMYVVLALVVPCAVLAILLHHRDGRQPFSNFPRTTLWAWERPEDLRTVDPAKFAIAYLDQTITITDHVAARPRFQPLLVPPSAKVISVVRIEAPGTQAQLNQPDLVNRVAEGVVDSARRTGVSALQIDFDAAQSQHGFYTELLREVRSRMPAGMPLSITALASWCSRPGWLEDLPVDEAVPMFFRMGRDPLASNKPGWKYPIRQRVCSASAGVSTDEVWPRIEPEQRVYVFHSRSWDPSAVNNVAKLVER